MSFAPKKCPDNNCPFNLNSNGKFIKKGHFYIKCLNQYVRKFQCKACLKIFSSRTFKIDYRHKRMIDNVMFVKLLTEGNSIRGIGRILNFTYKNAYNKFLWFKSLVEVEKAKLRFEAESLQIDELETYHHTKCKPLSVVLVVNNKHKLLEAKVAEMPAKGKLAEFSRKKYGYRKDERKQKLAEALESVKSKLQNRPKTISSDANPSYPNQVSRYFAGVRFIQHNQSKKEKHRDKLHETLHKKEFDPLFAVNHKCALLRRRINRLARKTWCATKKIENLQLHLDLFIVSQPN